MPVFIKQGDYHAMIADAGLLGSKKAKLSQTPLDWLSLI
jgi:hypothetical protein